MEGAGTSQGDKENLDGAISGMLTRKKLIERSHKIRLDKGLWTSAT